MSRKPAGSERGWDTGSHQDFYRYYAAQSGGASARERFMMIQSALLKAVGGGAEPLNVADVGCGAGTQCRLWAEHGHQVYGADINYALIALARRRAAESGLDIAFDVASATALPWPDQSMDLCIVPELLEHVTDWRACIAELVRVLRPGGALYVSTTNRLCPLQEEYILPLYAWYPGWIKRHCEQLARSRFPRLAGFATYPAVNWFTFFMLRDHLSTAHGMRSLDRFEMADPGQHGVAGRWLLALARRVPLAHLCAHVATPYTVLLAFKPEA
ncbi:MAG: methyltransferase domain-containing protein [Massilia sp.]